MAQSTMSRSGRTSISSMPDWRPDSISPTAVSRAGVSRARHVWWTARSISLIRHAITPKTAAPASCSLVRGGPDPTLCSSRTFATRCVGRGSGMVSHSHAVTGAGGEDEVCRSFVLSEVGHGPGSMSCSSGRRSRHARDSALDLDRSAAAGLFVCACWIRAGGFGPGHQYLWWRARSRCQLLGHSPCG